MKMIRIETSSPLLEVQSTRARIQITSNRRSFTVEQTPTKMKINRQTPKMHMNWEKINAQMGRRSPSMLKSYLYDLNKQKYLSGVQQIVGEGEQVGNVNEYAGSGSDPFAQIAVQNMRSDKPEVNVANMPQDLPEADWSTGSVQMEWTIGDVEIQWDENFMPEFEVTPYSVEIRLDGRPEVRITLDEGRTTTAVGNNVNRKI